MAERIQRVAAYGVIVRDDQILLCQLTRSRQWTLPGGGIDFGETPVDAVVREVQEETGFDVNVGELIGVYSYLKKNVDEVHGVQIMYSAEITGGSMRSEVDGTTDLCEWHNLSDLTSLDVVDMIRECVADHLKID